MTSALYPWLKAFHIAAMVAWMAALLYLPRLFVYHAGVAADSEAASLFTVMERRLLKAIMTPAMIATWLLGIAMLVLEPAWLQEGWLHLKLLFVLALSAGHGLMAGWQRAFAERRNRHSARFFRMVNELPALAMLAIVLLVILKPF